jgi:hypothetical protein
MAKYSVNGTEIIDDSGLIDWIRLANNPGAANVSQTSIGTLTNCGTDMALTVSRTANTTNGLVVFTFASVQTGTAWNCNCNCPNSFNCNC